MNNKKFLIITSLCLIFFSIQIQQSYGHGWGIDTASVEIDDREISISVEIPQDFDELDDKYISITAIDK